MAQGIEGGNIRMNLMASGVDRSVRVFRDGVYGREAPVALPIGKLLIIPGLKF